MPLFGPIGALDSFVTVNPPPSNEAAAVPAPPCVVPSAASDPAEWFTQKVYTHEGQLKAWLRRTFPGVRSEVDDVVQESYLKIWKRHARRPVEATKAFLFILARNTAVDLLRRKKAIPLAETPGETDCATIMEEGLDPAAVLTYREKVSLVAAALAELPDRCREVLVLRKFKGVSQREAARQLGLAEKTIEGHVARGMKLVEAYLRQHGLDGLYRDEK